jgi:two-component system cell cycle sensor histidine kinase/response regulator CckA
MTDDTPRLLEDIAELRRRLTETENRLERAQRIDSLGFLTAGIVHDLSNLLTPLLAASSLLALHVRPGTPAADLAGEIRVTAERSAALVRQLLMFLRGMPPRPAVLSLNAVLRDMRPLLERLVGSDVTLALALGEDLGDSLADRHQLEQAIVNLAANARDAMPAGGTLTIRTANVDLDGEDESSPGKYVTLVLTDTGSGMTPETQARAFEGLFTTKGEDGTGLGLAAVVHFATKSGGRVTVWSKVGIGTTFVVHLPRLPRPPPEASAADAPAGAGSSG